MSLFVRPSEGDLDSRALKIARAIVADELESIHRIHSRTLAYITGYTTVIALGFAALGWLGYDKLQSIVLSATRKNVQEQTLQRVNAQVDQDLAKMDVKGIIVDRIAAFAASDLQVTPIKQIQRGPVND